MATYSYGEQSPLKFEISDKLADQYNAAVERYLKAHRRFTQKFGRPWEPHIDPISIDWTRKQERAWNKMVDVVDKALEEYGSPVHANDLMEDYLVRNVYQAVVDTAGPWGRVITWAVGAGALYALLRRR